jgi:Cu+-exporting ATPase
MDFMISGTFFNNPWYIYINYVLSTIIQFYIGYPFYTSAYKAIKHKAANMDVLVVLGTTASWMYGVILIF